MKSIGIMFGRFNPITKGHMLLVKELNELNVDEKRIYISHTQDKLNNPLPYWLKYSYIEAMVNENFPSIKVMDSELRTIIQIVKSLSEEGFTSLCLIVGSDRKEGFEELLNKYNGDLYSFDSIDVISAGKEREDSSEDYISSLSASKLRHYAAVNDWENFRKGIPTTNDNIAYDLYLDVRKYMGYEE